MLSVSVVMTTFNGDRFLDQQLESIRSQILRPMELIICDDGSHDNTEAIVMEFSRSSPFPTHWIKNDHRLGYRHNFMKAVEYAVGDLIAFSDQDDIWRKDKLLKSSMSFSKYETLMTYHSVDLIDSEGRYIGSYHDRTPNHNPIISSNFNPWLFGLGFTLTFRRNLVSRSELWPISKDFYDAAQPLAHDQWFFLLASALGEIFYIDEPLAEYRQHSANSFGFQGKRQERNAIYKTRLNARYSNYNNYKESFQSIYDIVSRLSEKENGNLSKNLQSFARDYLNLAQKYQLSADMIGKQNITMRVMAILRLCYSGFYIDEYFPQVEKRSLLKDLAACMVSIH